VAAHWGCLASTQKDEILRNIREKDCEALGEHDKQQGSSLSRKRLDLEVDQMTEFICGRCILMHSHYLISLLILPGSCSRGGFCMGCMETVIKADLLAQPKTNGDTLTKETPTAGSSSTVSSDSAVARALFFRCFMCKRLAHYGHLPKSPGFEDASVTEIAEHYQNTKKWLCADCSSFKYDLDKIIAWRPYPPNALEPVRNPDEVPNHKHHLPREYLIKWKGRSYRRLDWVPHMWLASTKPHKLKNFIINGTRVDLLEEPVQDNQARTDVDTAVLPTFDRVVESRSSSVKPETAVRFPVGPMPDAQQRIPLPWKTVHRVLDVVLWRPNGGKRAHKRIAKRTIASSSEEDNPVDHKRIVFQRGEQPADELTVRVDDWETRKPLEITDVKEVAWAFIKWDELGYEEGTHHPVVLFPSASLIYDKLAGMPLLNAMK
jgi:chromodomain-helicase-DNA-binding protein 4